MDNRVLSGESLFLLYAHPCTARKQRKGLIGQEDAQELGMFVKEGRSPSRELLQRCFPEAYRSFVQFAEIGHPERDWPVEVVRNFWRQHKGGCLSCAVMCGKVEMVMDMNVRVRCPDKTVIALNPYGLPVEIGNIVYFHLRVIAEVE